jgi:septal ring factor EnvC (AmiA/AmiB activator)
MAGRWVDVGEASRELGVSSDAVRKRIARGSLESSRQNGSVLVWLDEDWTEAGREAQLDGGPLVEDLREQVHYLRSILNEEREARRRADMIIAQLTQANATLAAKVPELEAPQEAPGGQESASEEPERAAEPRSGTGGPQESAERPRDTAEWPVDGTLLRPWWRRVFGAWARDWGVADTRPRDDRDAAQDLARELADLAAQLASLKGEANAWLSDESYDALKHRLEDAHASVEAAAVEARRRVRLNEGRERWGECPARLLASWWEEK